MSKNPFNYGNPVSGKQFIGRWKQVEDVASDLSNSGGHSHALIGGRRFGKSSFLKALEEVLIKQLMQEKPEDPYILPVFISLKSLDEHSSGGVFALMLRTLYDYFHSPLLRRNLGFTLDFDVSQTQLATFKHSNDVACSFDRFSDIIEELLNYFINTYGLLHIVFLLDETEEILDQQWTEKYFRPLTLSGLHGQAT